MYQYETIDRGYGHFSTRQNIQFNWPALERVPDILDELAEVDMHAIQNSGNCIRSTTVDHFAGVAPDEVLNPLVYAEIIRQWSTLHPEFAFLPRKFKISLSGSPEDTAAVMAHDIGLNAVFDYDGRPGFTVAVGGCLGRTPIVGHVIREFLPAADLLTYLDAILRVYNMHGRRDNKYKARIKSLVKELGVAELRRQVEHEWSFREGGPGTLTADEIARPGGTGVGQGRAGITTAPRPSFLTVSIERSASARSRNGPISTRVSVEVCTPASVSLRCRASAFCGEENTPSCTT